VVPGCRRQQGAVARHGERRHRGPVPFEHCQRRLLAGNPDCNARIIAAGDGAAVPEQGDRVDGTVMEAQHRLCGIAIERPADHRGIEAPRNRGLAVGGYREGADRPAVPAQLRARHASRKQQARRRCA
jgi:hypothetical protein